MIFFSEKRSPRKTPEESDNVQNNLSVRMNKHDPLMTQK